MSRPFGDGVRSCLGCYQDPATGHASALDAFSPMMIHAGVYFLCALIGALAGMLPAVIVMDGLFDMKPGMPARDLVVVLCAGAAVGLGLRIAHRNQMGGKLQGDAPDLPLPPGASRSRQTARRNGLVIAGVCFAFFSLGFPLQRYFKGYEDWFLGFLAAGGALGGWLWFRLKARD